MRTNLLSFTFAKRNVFMMTSIIRNFFIASILLVVFSNKSFSQNATLTVNEDPKIASLLKIQKGLEKENQLSLNFTIQLFYGELNRAQDILRRYKANFNEDWPGSIEYETPNYKVWAGNFSSRIEAERALKQIQKEFPSAFILKPERRK